MPSTSGLDSPTAIIGSVLVALVGLQGWLLKYLITTLNTTMESVKESNNKIADAIARVTPCRYDAEPPQRGVNSPLLNSR